MVVLVLDNGAGNAKVGFSTDSEPKVIPNCVLKAKNVRTRIFIGDQIEDCKDLSGLYYLLPFQKGYLVNWEIEKQVWDYMFGKEQYQVEFSDTSIVLTEPYFNFSSIQEGMTEILFEEYQFKSAFRTNPGYLSQYKLNQDKPGHLCSLVVDTGYSFSHIIPYYKGEKLKESVYRVNMGGKVMTNHLKEIVSYRQLMVMDETYVINQLKEDVCYVSTQFNKDMQISRKKGADKNSVMRDYVLPDYTHIKRGYIRPLAETTGRAKENEQIIRMNNERFAVPELLFHPSDVGIHEMGITEALVHAIGNTDKEMHPHLYGNILTTGGNCLIPGFDERFYSDVRSMAPDLFDISVTSPKNPDKYSWYGGAQLANSPDFENIAVTKEEFEEHGHNICLEKFDV